MYTKSSLCEWLCVCLYVCLCMYVRYVCVCVRVGLHVSEGLCVRTFVQTKGEGGSRGDCEGAKSVDGERTCGERGKCERGCDLTRERETAETKRLETEIE